MKRLFFDIETSLAAGLFWRPTWKAKINYEQVTHQASIICLSYAWEKDLRKAYDEAVDQKMSVIDRQKHITKQVKCIRWNKGDDKKLVERAVKILEEADELIAHNGPRFDFKWMKARALIHGVPMNPYMRINDTLKRARESFNLPSNRLAAIADYLGEGNKLKTDYSWWVILSSAVHFTRNFDDEYKEIEDLMCTYCDHDVAVLFLVWLKLAPASKHLSHKAVLDGGERYDCPHCGSDQIKHETSYTTTQGTVRRQMKCKSCRKYYVISNKAYMEYLAGKDFGSRS
jgi:hypothetical protein